MDHSWERFKEFLPAKGSGRLAGAKNTEGQQQEGQEAEAAVFLEKQLASQNLVFLPCSGDLTPSLPGLSGALRGSGMLRIIGGKHQALDSF